MKKLSNKVLLITLVILVGLFALSRIFRSPALESNLRKELVSLDTAAVTEVRISPSSSQGTEVKLIQEGNAWKVTADGKEAAAEAGTVESMLGVIKELKAQRMVSRKKEKWETYELGENSTRVSIYSDQKKLADFRVGKTGFARSEVSGVGGAYTYVRLSDEDEIYSADGFLASHFNRDFNGWRNKAFLRLKKDDITKITFTYPDSSFVLEKRDSVWYANNEPATKADVYLNKLQFKNINEFEEGFTPPTTAPISIQINGAVGNLVTLQAWPRDEEEWILSSTLQNGVYFKGKKSGVVKDVFVGLGALR